MGGGPYYAAQGGSRILDATRVDKSGADNSNVTNWVKTDDFIIAININSGGKDTVAAQYKLRWRNKTDAGSFVDVAATGVINYSATTYLVNGATILVGGRKCDSQGDTWQNGKEVEGAVNSDSIDLAQDYETEIHFGLDCSGATDGKEYEFELYDDTLEVTRGTCGATLRILIYPITELDELEHDISNGNYNSLVWIDSTHFMLAYDSGGGRIKTFSIDGSYNISQVHNLQHDANQGIYNSLVQIDSTHYILAYSGNLARGYIKTFTIDGSYQTTQIDALGHYTVSTCTDNSLVKIDSTHYMLVSKYSASGKLGIKTFSIDGSYNITQETAFYELDSYGSQTSLVMIDSTHFIVAYRSGSYSGDIKTFSIDGSYNVTPIDSHIFDGSTGNNSCLIKLDSTHYMLAYAGGGYDGYIKVFTIDGSYDISETTSFEHDIASGQHNSLVKIDSTYYMLAYYGGFGDDGIMKLLSMDGSYNVSFESSLVHDTYGTYNSLVMINSTHYILSYAGPGSDGYISTFSYALPTVGIARSKIDGGFAGRGLVSGGLVR